MRNRILLCAGVLLASCSVLQPETPQQKLVSLVEKHPELAVADTVHDTVTVEIPRIEFRKVFVPVVDTVQQRADRALLDSLLNRVELSLDSVQRAAARQQIQQWAAQRPVLNDTLCFDTLGVQGRVWRDGSTYQLWLERKHLTASAPVEVVVEKLMPCPPAPSYLWYDPRGWPYWLLLTAGFITGVVVSFGLFRAALTAAR